MNYLQSIGVQSKPNMSQKFCINVNLCRVNCGFCLPGVPHYCKNCKTHDVDHRSKNCPTLLNKVPVQPVQPVQPTQPARPARQVPRQPIPTGKNIVGTLTVIVENHNEKYILCCVRNVRDKQGTKRPLFGKIMSHGGSADPGELPDVCAIREAEEEAGIYVNINDIQLHSSKSTQYNEYYNYRVVYNTFPKVYGPNPGTREEDESQDVPNILGVSTIKNKGYNTRQAWVPISLLMQNPNDHTFDLSSF
jgi:8-oxo-dGTP pyrophosphatase MutT (NUDIX family)